MKKIILSAIALGLSAAPAFAQPYDREAAANRDRAAYEDERFSQGDRLPDRYMEKQFVYYGWRDSGLHRPPAGYQWRLVHHTFMLVNERDRRIAEQEPAP